MTSDPCLPVRHVRPQRGWINDPNGVCRWGGRWHVFHQMNPDEPRHGQIHWGHASSEDLVTWREEPIALYPRPGGLDQQGCWSGCFTLDEGVPTLCYTAVATTPADAVGVIARGSDDLRSWDQAETPSAPRVGCAVAETRDPFVVWINGKRYVIQGHGGPGVGAQVLVHDATDLAHWKLLGPLLEMADPVAAEHAAADIWECPNLVQVDGQWVLVVSLWRHNGVEGELSGVRWLVGDISLEKGYPRFTARDGGVVDEGPAFYAPQLLVDDEGNSRVLMWAWSWELGRDEEWLAEHGWAGVLTTARELHIDAGRLVTVPAREVLEAARGELGDTWRAGEAAVVATTAGPGRLVCEDADGPCEVRIPGRAMILVDGSLVEVFCDGMAHTTRIYPREGSCWRLEAEGARVRRIS